jgi:hypothetical protein
MRFVVDNQLPPIWHEQDAKERSFQRMRRVRPKVSGAGQAVAGSVQAAPTS